MQLHVSGINMLNDCGIRYMFRYMLGIKHPPSAYLLVGSSIDESVTQNLGNKITRGELLPREDVLGIAAARFEKGEREEPIELDPDEKRAGLSKEQVLSANKDKTVALAGLHHDTAAPIIHATAVRRSFSVNMDNFLKARARGLRVMAEHSEDRAGIKLLDEQATSLNSMARRGIDFVGEQDIVERDVVAKDGETKQLLIIRDTKSSTKSPTKSLMDGASNPGIADDSEQLTGYAVASHVIDKKLPDLMVLDYLIRTDKRFDLKYVPTRTVRDMNDVDVFLNRFANAMHAIKTGTFVPANPTFWGCSEKYCGFWHMCPYAKRPHQVRITTKVPE